MFFYPETHIAIIRTGTNKHDHNEEMYNTPSFTQPGINTHV